MASLWMKLHSMSGQGTCSLHILFSFIFRDTSRTPLLEIFDAECTLTAVAVQEGSAYSHLTDTFPQLIRVFVFALAIFHCSTLEESIHLAFLCYSSTYFQVQTLLIIVRQKSCLCHLK